MFNLGGGEILVILLVALLVLGPGKLPDAARQIGSVLTHLRRVSTGFQNELKSTLDAPPDRPTTGERDAGAPPVGPPVARGDDDATDD
jgi:Tat protein translocase TatB subunit